MIDVGDWVVIRDDAARSLPIPVIARRYPQRVVRIEGDLVVVERWILRFKSWVPMTVPIVGLDPVPQGKEPQDFCLVYAASRRGSAFDSFKRGWCSPCSLRDRCEWYQSRHAGRE